MSAYNYYGIDIGGTTVKLGRFTPEGLAEKWEIPTNTAENGTHILRDIAASLPGPGVGAAMGVPGAVLPDGTVNRCINLGWDICRPGEEFETLTGIPCRVGNDANLAALGEQWLGGGRGFGNVLLVTLGTGVGAGIVQNGHLLPGCNGAAGEFGHICMNPSESEPCSCGNRGCLEQYCSATGILRLARKAGLDILEAKDVFSLAKTGNESALSVVDTACDLLGRGLAAACCVIDPEVILLGGGVSKAGEFLRLRVESAFRKYAFHACRDTQIRLATLGNDAGIYGAARLAME